MVACYYCDYLYAADFLMPKRAHSIARSARIMLALKPAPLPRPTFTPQKRQQD